VKVLIVDDVGYSRHYHSRMLQKFGYDTLVAETGPQALRLLERDSSIDAVLTDLLMRDMDGLELYSAAQAIDRMTDAGSAEPPAFIMMTAARPGSNAQPRDLEKIRVAKQVGFVDVLFKPIEPDLLQRTLETIKYARSKTTESVDLGGLVQRLTETIGKIVDGRNASAAQQLGDELQVAMQKLEPMLTMVGAK
jgi:CheY-like chemotaxis protein